MLSIGENKKLRPTRTLTFNSDIFMSSKARCRKDCNLMSLLVCKVDSIAPRTGEIIDLVEKLLQPSALRHDVKIV